MINKHIIFKFFREFINHEKKTNRAIVFSYNCLPNILKYCDHRWNFPKFRRFWRIKIHSDTNWKIQLIYIWKFRFTVLQNYHWNTKKMGNLWLIKVGYDPNWPTWEPYLTNLRVKGISCSFSLVLEGKIGKEIPESSWLEILEKISTKTLLYPMQKTTPKTH